MIYRILIVEDDPTIVTVLTRQLEKWDYEVSAVSDFDRVLDTFRDFDPHLVLLDISLPFYNGYYWCSEIRKISRVPVLFISSASDNMNLVMAINMGADDLIAKPFHLEVILAKIQANMRRAYAFGCDAHIISRRGVTLNLNDASLSYGTQQITLSKNEFKLMQVLLEHLGSVVSREELIQKLWETDSFIDDNTLTVNITRLRRHLEEIGLANFILTKKGIGYLVEESE